MKKILLLSVILCALGSNAQTVLFEDSFEFNDDFAIDNISGWTLTDSDLQVTYGVTQGGQPVTFTNSGAAMAYIVMNNTATTPALNANWAAHTGTKTMVAMASIPDSSPTNDDYLTSPQILLGASGNTLKFWAKAISATYPERFKVGVSTTGTAPADFTFITPAAGVTPTTSWVEYSYSLDAYQGQNVYITINCISQDAFAFFVDDFKVTTTALTTQDFFNNSFSIQPNPVNDVFNLTSKNGVALEKVNIVDINGRIVNEINVSGTQSVQINISDLNSGVYFVKVQSDLGVGTTKIIKK